MVMDDDDDDKSESESESGKKNWAKNIPKKLFFFDRSQSGFIFWQVCQQLHYYNIDVKTFLYGTKSKIASYKQIQTHIDRVGGKK